MIVGEVEVETNRVVEAQNQCRGVCAVQIGPFDGVLLGPVEMPCGRIDADVVRVLVGRKENLSRLSLRHRHHLARSLRSPVGLSVGRIDAQEPGVGGNDDLGRGRNRVVGIDPVLEKICPVDSARRRSRRRNHQCEQVGR